MSLRVFNVLRREKVEFVPLTPGKVNMYVCGPTVYDHAHLGHAKTYVSFDMVVRYLRRILPQAAQERHVQRSGAR